ncbi:MAG: hypothetical protein HC777_02930, partial [Hyphomonadaceae bacterium]|nr:hypothetical protein [Hyphomonadaceae bacterium]
MSIDSRRASRVDVRSVVLEALLQRLGGRELPEEYVPLLRRRLKDESPLVRDIARREILPRYLKSARSHKADGSLFTASRFASAIAFALSNERQWPLVVV